MKGLVVLLPPSFCKGFVVFLAHLVLGRGGARFAQLLDQLGFFGAPLVGRFPSPSLSALWVLQRFLKSGSTVPQTGMLSDIAGSSGRARHLALATQGGGDKLVRHGFAAVPLSQFSLLR